MIAVVSGSSGFIGSHLVQRLLARGATVRALVRPQSPRDNRNVRVTYHEADLLDAQAVADSSVWSGATHFFHLAGLTTATSLAEFRRGNVQPLANILDALCTRAAPPRVVVVSSQAAAGPARSRSQPVRETDIAAPVEPYGLSKREAEQLAEASFDKLLITIVRPPAVYGPWDTDFLPAFKQATSAVALHAINPDFWFDLVYIDDVVRALEMTAVSAAAVGQTYFLSSDDAIRWRDFYEMVGTVAGVNARQVKVPLVVLQSIARIGDAFGFVTRRTPLLNSHKLALAAPEFWICSSQRIRDELGWRPEVTPQNGVRQTYLWYVDAEWLSRKQGVTETL